MPYCDDNRARVYELHTHSSSAAIVISVSTDPAEIVESVSVESAEIVEAEATDGAPMVVFVATDTSRSALLRLNLPFVAYSKMGPR